MEGETSVKQRREPKPEAGLSTIRVVVSVVIIIACFSTLYPKFFHPIVMRVLGLAPPKEKPDKMPQDHPPNRRMPDERPNGHSRGMPMEDDIRRHMRPGPHPGMRAAAEMNKQKQGSSSGRGGMMGMILPVYAFGIIGYLVYTLLKVFGKKGNNQDSPFKRRGYSPPNKVTEQSSLDETSNKLQGLEDLLDKASNVDPNISADEMRELQKRLEETERQMSQILNAMQQVSAKVNTVASETAQTQEKGEVSDSSPDMSSYEVVDKEKDKKNSSDEEKEKALKGKDTQTDKDESNEDNEEIKDTEEIIEDKKVEEEESGVRQRKGPNVSSE